MSVARNTNKLTVVKTTEKTMSKRKPKYRTQSLMSAPSRVLVGSVTTKSGQVKNKYKPNPEAKVLKTIVHSNY